ncbi:MAG: ABC transporter substrate-binding protein [Herpetosiphon sp.]
MPKNLRTDLKGKTVTYLGSDNGSGGADYERKLIAEFTKTTGITVKLLEGPASATERLAQYLQQLGAQASDVDVFQIDVIWPGILAQHAEDLTKTVKDSGTQYFERIVKNNTVDGKLVGIPYYTDAGLLYFRSDLLKKYDIAGPPQTWKELEDAAKKIQEGERAAGNKDFWGFVWQGGAYEGLTCDALEWQVSQGGGSIVEPDGKITINNAQAAAAFDRAKSWIGTISPPGVTGYKEEDSRGVWQAGNAAFMRNWPYAYALGQNKDEKTGQAPVIAGKFDVVPLPQGEGTGAQHADTLGGWQLMVSKYSKNKEAAMELVKFMTSAEVQKARAIDRAMLPTIASVYSDPDVIKAQPYYPKLLPVFQGGAVPRPSTVTADLYNDVSTAYFTAVNQVLTGQKSGKAAVADLEKSLKDTLKK